MIPKEYFSGLHCMAFLLGLMTFALWVLMDTYPELSEHLYARNVYPFIASQLAWLGSLAPFALTSMIFIVIGLWFFLIPFVQYRFNKELGFFGVINHIVLSGISSVLFLFAIFSLTFLFNHHRYSEERLFQLDFELDETRYQRLVDISVARANELSATFPKNQRLCSDIDFSIHEIDELIEQEQTRFLTDNHLPSVRNAKTRYFLLSSIWSGMGMSGQYQPLLGQTNITRELPVYSMPFVVAHERGHLNGFASETGASLLGMQTLFHARDLRLEYLGLLGLWRSSPPESVNEQVARDLQCWDEDYKNIRRFEYKKWATKLNDTYLKMSGHDDGVESYSRGHLLGLKYYFLNFVKYP